MLSYNEFKEAVLAESVEQLDELSKKTLGSYIKKANASAIGAGMEVGFHNGSGGNSDSKFKQDQKDKLSKRRTGIAKAVNKLTKEEHEVLESLLAKLDEEKLAEAFAVHRHGGSIGSGGPTHYSTHETKEDAKEEAKRLNKGLSPGEKKYYGIKYKVSEVKGVKEGYDVIEYSLESLDEVHVSQKDWEEDQALKSRPSKFDKKLTKEEVEVLEGLLAKLED